MLVALASIPSISLVFPDSSWRAPALALAAGAGAALFSARSALARRVGAASAIAPALYLLSFAASGLLQRLTDLGPSGELARVAKPGAAIIAVFDELPLDSLLDSEGSIDAKRFPNFASLATDAVWFSNTSAAAGLTTLAVPAIATGQHPDPSKFPLAGDHPQNLFAWLGAQMPLRVQEPRTRLTPPRFADARDFAVPSLSGRLRLLASDAALLYAHFALPRELAAGLPPVDEDWIGFAPGGASAQAHEVAELKRSSRERSKVSVFFDFLRSLEPCPDACLVFVHCVMPHVPWMYTPTGAAYPTWAFTPGLSARDKRWSDDEAWVGEAWQRHLFQVHLVDLMLGRFVARLRELGLYERALLIVTADHGISLRPGVLERGLSAAHPHPEDLLRVPLFVRAPGLPRGRVDARPAASVDIAPTVADFLGSELPWPHDGVSLLGAEAPGQRPRRLAISGDGESIVVPEDLADRRSARELRARWLPVAGDIDGLYARGPHAATLFGASVPALAADPDPVAVELSDATFSNSASIPLRLLGRIAAIDSRRNERPSYAAVAAAVGGRIRAVAPLARGPDARPVFSIFLPERLSKQPFDVLELYLVSGTAAAPRLARAGLHRGLAFRELVARGPRAAVAPVTEEVGDADAE
jgi:hypothetical protein